MSILQNKIDFAVIITATAANPNGDPLNGNMPRTTFSGLGEISDVCLKRKLRNRLMDIGENIFVQSDDKNVDGFKSLRDRANSVNELKATKNSDEFAKIACENWIDVRSFGQVFAFKAEKDDKNGGISVGVRGPVSIHPAFSLDTVDITSTQITKSVNGETTETGKKASDTMGTKHRIDFGVYLIKGSINIQLAEKTGFTEEDAEKIKESLRTIFINDTSSARPDGSMEVVKLYWWKHNCKIGQYSSKKVHDSISIVKKADVEHSAKIEDYDINITDLDNLTPEIYDGI